MKQGHATIVQTMDAANARTNEPLMTRYLGYAENLNVLKNIEEQQNWNLAYGFDRGGITGETSYFIQAWLLDKNGNQTTLPPTWSDTGGKDAITESPFWEVIAKHAPEHAKQIALDLPF